MYVICFLLIFTFIMGIVMMKLRGRNKKTAAYNQKISSKRTILRDTPISKEIDKINFKDIVKK